MGSPVAKEDERRVGSDAIGDQEGAQTGGEGCRSSVRGLVAGSQAQVGVRSRSQQHRHTETPRAVRKAQCGCAALETANGAGSAPSDRAVWPSRRKAPATD